MKPPPFSYHRGRTVEHAAELLRELGPSARLLAGGQSLLPMLNLRLAEPAHLVDLGSAPGLDVIRRDGDMLVVGATARQAAVEHSSDVRALVPLLAEAVEHVAHPPIRHRGTVVGSIAHASAVAELPCAAVALNAQLTLLSADGVRTVGAEEFFTGAFTTSARADEIVAQVAFPVTGPGTGQAWSEFSLRRGNFPVAGAGASVTVADGEIVDVAIAICGVSDRPVRARAAEAALLGTRPGPEVVAAAAAASIADLAPRVDGDLAAHILPVVAAPVPAWGYRASVAKSQVRRAVTTALTRAGGVR